MKLNYKTFVRSVSLLGLYILPITITSAQTSSPKNIIVVIGDGMGYSCIQAADYYSTGSEKAQAYEKFPVMTWQSTFNTKNATKGVTDDQALYYDMEYRSDSAWIDFDWVRRDADVSLGTTHSNGQTLYNAARYTDSAPAATALSTGRKTFDGSINIDVAGNELFTIAQHAIGLGKKAGVVSTVQFAHATPAGFIAHNSNRNDYAGISREMLVESQLSVIIGTGHPDYNDDAQYDEGVNGYNYVGGENIWKDLLEGSITLDGSIVADIDNDKTADSWTLIQDTEDFVNIGNCSNLPKRLLGIPKAGSTLQAYRSGGGNEVLEAPYNENLPTLSDMSKAALNVLKNDKGFFVMIEGGAIDWANHANAPGRMIEEMTDLNNAVNDIIQWIEANGGWEENLLIITSDHECGYVVGPNTQGETVNNPVDNPIINNGKGEMPGFAYHSVQHTNMLCPVYAKGAGAELLKKHESRTDFYRGKYIDNTDIPRTLFALWPENKQTIKNFILMVSDGWGYNQITATNYYEGKTQSYESFPVIAPMSTFPGRRGNYSAVNALELYTTGYNSYKAWTDFDYLNQDYTDSAPAATAMATGEKIYDSALNVKIEDSSPLITLPEIATQKGKSAGVVSSVQLSHATPAGLGGAHNKDRNAYGAISQEMFFDTNLSVIIGAGHPNYDNQGGLLDEPSYSWIQESTWNALQNGRIENDGQTLTDISGDGTPDAWTFIEDSVDFASIMNGKNVPLRLAGIPKVHETLQAYRANPALGTSGDLYGPVKFDTDALPRNKEIPQLYQMSLASLNVLNQNENGFFLMIEGGAVDWCNHANQLGIMIEEQRDFNMAIDSVINWIEKNSSWDETLLVVTGDHECGYLIGPDHKGKTDNDPDTNPIVNRGKGVVPDHSYHSASHTNQLIPLYAKGVSSDKLHSYRNMYDYKRGYYLDNTDIPHLVREDWSTLADVEPDISTRIEYISGENKKERILKVYPTLVDDYLTVDAATDMFIDIYDLNGNLVFREKADGDSPKININSLQKGMYIVKSDDKQAKIVKR